MNTVGKFGMGSTNSYTVEKKRSFLGRWKIVLLIILLLLLLSLCYALSSSTFVVPNFLERRTDTIESNLGFGISGTPDQVIVNSDSLGNITLLTPQPISINSAPTFGGLTIQGLNGNLRASNGRLVVGGIDLSDEDEVTNILSVNNGGTGLALEPSLNQILVGDDDGGYRLATLTAGTGVTLDIDAGNITINSTNTGVSIPIQDNDNQLLSVSGYTLSISGGNTITLPLPPPSGVTNITTGSGLSGGPITSTGTISIDAPSCIVGEVLTWDGTSFSCVSTGGAGTVTNIATGNGLSGGPISSSGTISVSAPTCSGTDKLQWNGSAFVCSIDLDSGGTVTNIATGNGLSGGPISSSGTISINSPTCSIGEFLTWNGTSFICVQGNTGTITNVVAGAGLINSGTAESPTLDIVSGNTGITVNADNIELNTSTSGVTSTTSSNSGLEISSGGLRLLGGCADEQVLKWNALSSAWQCSNDSGLLNSITSINGEFGPAITISAGNNLTVTSSSNTITLGTVNNPTFSTSVTTPTVLGSSGLSINPDGALSINGFTTGLLQSDASGVITSGLLDLGSGPITGILGIGNGGTGISTVPLNGQLLIGNGAGYTLGTLTAGTGITINNSAGNVTISAPSTGGITTINSLTDSIQTFAVGTSGVDFSIVSASGTHTFNLPSASATARGVITTLAQTIAGDKTFTNNISVNGNTTLGTDSSQTVTFNAGVNSNITPSIDNTYDLGTLVNRWRDLYLGPGSLRITSTPGTSGSTSNHILGTLGYTGTDFTLQTRNIGTATGGTINLVSGIDSGLGSTSSGFGIIANSELEEGDRLLRIANNSGISDLFTISGTGVSVLDVHSETSEYAFNLNHTFSGTPGATDSSGFLLNSTLESGGFYAGVNANLNTDSASEFNDIRGLFTNIQHSGTVSNLFGIESLVSASGGSTSDVVTGINSEVEILTGSQVNSGLAISTGIFNNIELEDFHSILMSSNNTGTINNETSLISGMYINLGSINTTDMSMGRFLMFNEATGFLPEYYGINSSLMNNGTLTGSSRPFYGHINNTGTITNSTAGLTLDLDNHSNIVGEYVGSEHDIFNNGTVGGDISGTRTNIYNLGLSSDIYGLQINLHNVGTASNFYGLRINNSFNSTGFSNSYYGAYIESATLGALDNIGLYLGNVSGGLSTNYSIYSAGGDAYFTNGLRVGSAVSSIEGIIRYSSGSFEGFDGTSWIEFGGGSTATSYWESHVDGISYDGGSVVIDANTPFVSENYGLHLLAISGGTDLNSGIRVSSIQGAEYNMGISIGSVLGVPASGASTGLFIQEVGNSNNNIGIEIAEVSGGSFRTGLLMGPISGNGSSIGIDLGNIQATGTAYGMRLGNVISVGTGDAFGLRIGNVAGGGTGNRYGIYLEGATGGSGNNASLWINSGLSRFAPSTATQSSINIATGVDPVVSNIGDLWWNGTNLNFNTGNGVVDLLSSSGVGGDWDSRTEGIGYSGGRVEITDINQSDSLNRNIGLMVHNITTSANNVNNYGIYVGTVESQGGQTNYGIYVDYIQGGLNWGLWLHNSNAYVGGSIRTASLNTCLNTLEVDEWGTIICGGSSDINLKENIQSIGSALDKVLLLDGYSYNFKSETSLGSHRQFGFIAQDVESIIPELVYTNEDGTKGVRYQQFIPFFAEAIKEQNTQINGMISALSDLETRVTALEYTVQDLQDSQLSGSVVIPVGRLEEEVVVDSERFSIGSAKVILTLKSRLEPAGVTYYAENTDRGFIIRFSEQISSELKFDYLIIFD